MAVATTTMRGGLLRRPKATTGFWSWFTTVDHKKIGILYGVTAIVFFFLGGLEAFIIRLQLARPTGPENTLVSAQFYDQIFTMHGVTMIFLVVMPLGSAFFNYLLPLMIGARDVAFPRLNAFSYWVFLFGGIFLYSSFLLGGAPNGGWFGYAPLSTGQGFLEGPGMTFYALGLQILGVASVASAVNFIVTIINMRAPGMSFMRMPVFVWMTFVVSFLLAFAMPVIAVALFQLMFDRVFGTNFYNALNGGDPVLWQHLFWLFGHPEVYILILPAMGIVSEILPVFSRKPLFGYPVVVFSGAAIGLMGWGVWAHHMFAVGMGPVANSAFALSTMFIAVPTGVKIFNWLATMWGGQIRFKTPMLFSIGFVSMFIIGGLSGVTHAIVPSDWQQTDTYYIVAHFHYVLFGGAIFGLTAGIYYWFPKVFGRMLHEGMGKAHFWLMFLGFNITFGPFHVLGLQGMPRRQYYFPAGRGWDFWNLVSTAGVFFLLAGFLVALANLIWSYRRGEIASSDPWDARTVEWSIPTNPPPPHNFDEIPQVRALDDFWHRKYAEDEGGRLVPVAAGGSGEEEHAEPHGGGHGHGIHMPDPSYYPVIASAGLPVIAFGVMYHSLPTIVAGGIVTVAGLFGWAFEPSAD